MNNVRCTWYVHMCTEIAPYVPEYRHAGVSTLYSEFNLYAIIIDADYIAIYTHLHIYIKRE